MLIESSKTSNFQGIKYNKKSTTRRVQQEECNKKSATKECNKKSATRRVQQEEYNKKTMVSIIHAPPKRWSQM
jgi:hypothetical protein